MNYEPQLLTPHTMARAEDLNNEHRKIRAAFLLAADQQGRAFAPYRATFGEALASFAVGEYFTSDATGVLRTYKRINGTPGYVDQGDEAAPLSRYMGFLRTSDLDGGDPMISNDGSGDLDGGII